MEIVLELIVFLEGDVLLFVVEIDVEVLGMEWGDSLVDWRGDKCWERLKEVKLVFIDIVKFWVFIIWRLDF